MLNINRTVVVDCGKNSAAYYNPITDTGLMISHKDLLSLHVDLKLKEGDTIVGEYSHLGCPRGELSLSQPFQAEELQKWYKSLYLAGINLLMFPQKSTPRAISYSGLGKSDIEDCKSIWKLLKDYPEISLMKPPTSFEPSEFTKEMWAWKSKTNRILNIARSDKYGLKCPESDKVTKWILDNFQTIYDRLSDNARDCFKLCLYKNGELKIKTNSDWLFSMPQLYSILSTMIFHNPDTGLVEIRTRNKETASNFLKNYDFKRYLLCATPFHLKGGVLRSNIYFHGMRNWTMAKAKNAGLNLKRKIKLDEDETMTIRRGLFTPEEEAFFVEHRAIYTKAVMEAYALFKSMLQEEYGLEIHNSEYSACHS